MGHDEGAAQHAETSVSETDEVPAVTDPTPAAAPDLVEEALVVEVDALCAAAVELARGVAAEVAGSAVGEHLGVEADDSLVVTHSFATTDPAYVGWRWAVTVARAEGTDEVTVDEVVLLPGSGALLAPAWVPWSERVQPGDLAPGDLLPPRPDDLRIVPAYTETEDELAAVAFWELGLGRPRVLSAEGRLEAAERWYDGDRGPSSPMARQAPGLCLDCAFRVPLAGALGALFGVCANALSPEDAKVVSLDHGCGAHSETAVELTHSAADAGMVVEDEEIELVVVGLSPDDETPDGHAS
ncbi:MAG: hypothetical protein JWM02_682 [Frankiales bacterium]|nr:hypothetical protein [Frankiales bacterium]